MRAALAHSDPCLWAYDSGNLPRILFRLLMHCFPDGKRIALPPDFPQVDVDLRTGVILVVH